MSVDRRNYLDDAEVTALMNAAELQAIKDLQRGRTAGVVTWMIVDTALQTGLRVQELASLKVEDIDVRKGTLYVLRQKRRRRKAGSIAIRNARPDKETIEVSPELTSHVKEFLAWRAIQIANMKDHIEGLTKDGGALFVGQRGAMTAGGLQQAWNALAKRAGVMRNNTREEPKNVSVPKGIHCARHTLGLRMLKKTGNLYAVQSQLGHANPQTTAAFYSDIAFVDMKEAVSGLYPRDKKDDKRKKK